MHDGDVLELGSVQMTVKHTPGHTPEHISLLVAKTNKKDAPFAVLQECFRTFEAPTPGSRDLKLIPEFRHSPEPRRPFPL